MPSQRMFELRELVRWKTKGRPSKLQHIATLRLRHGLGPFVVIRRRKASPGSAHPQQLELQTKGGKHILYDVNGRRCAYPGAWFDPPPY